MAGYRRAQGGQPQWRSRWQRRRERLNEALRGAKSNADRIAAAADYLRGATEHAPAAVVDAATQRAVEALVREADGLLTREGARR